MVKNPPAKQETQVQSLDQENALEKEIPVFLPGESHGKRSLAGYSLWFHKESDMTEQLTVACFLMFTAALLTIVKIWKQPDGHQQISSVQSLSRVQL